MRDNPQLFAPSTAHQRPTWLDGLMRVLLVVDAWLIRRHQRRNLMELSDHMLKDIGITRGEAYREGAKPFWRP